MRVGVIAIALVLASLALPGVAFAQAGDATTVAGQFLEAQNAHDVAAAVALFAEDGAIQNGTCSRRFGPQGCVGKARIREFLEGAASANQRLTVVVQTVAGNTVTQTGEETNNATRAAGVQRALFTRTITVQGGKIVLLRATLDSADPQTAAYQAYQARQASPTQLPRTGGSPLAALVLVGAGCLAVGASRRLASLPGVHARRGAVAGQSEARTEAGRLAGRL